MPFSGEKEDRNLLVKLASYKKILEAGNSLTCLDEFIEKTLQMTSDGVPDGIYNLTNPGFVMSSEIVDLLYLRKIRTIPPAYFQTSQEISLAMKSPRSSCFLDSAKAANLGFGFRAVHEALKICLDKLCPAFR